ncbi:MarR family transcriptional regulator [Streptomyces sp. me109]|nr:MarR family transcriptional regulator [Streptomyces sp. me109]
MVAKLPAGVPTGQRRRAGQIVNEQAGSWSFLTNHARVLIVIARDPASRVREVAAACHITERTAQSIVKDLEEAGYMRRERSGRRTRYTLCLGGTLRHPAEAHVPVRGLLELFTPQAGER